MYEDEQYMSQLDVPQSTVRLEHAVPSPKQLMSHVLAVSHRIFRLLHPSSQLIVHVSTSPHDCVPELHPSSQSMVLDWDSV